MDEDADAVVMMTIHSAKGLEFPNVFLCGMEDGIFPGFRSMEREDDLEEERRLCYVAITRAKQQLTMTCAERRMMYGQTRYSKPSQFIEELPAASIDSNISEAKPDEFEQLMETATPEYRSRRARDISGKSFGRSVRQSKRIAVIDLKPGDQVDHKAFGHGMITSCKPMGGDVLLEVSFDKIGTKRLMANAAMQFMKKL